MKKIYPALLSFIIFLFGCATVRPPVTEKVPISSLSKPEIQTESEHFLKRKVAIARFSNETKYGQGLFYDEKQDRIGKQAMDILSAKLTNTNKFLLLERVDLSFLSSEKEMNKISSANIMADYLIIGSVSEFGRKTTSDVGVFSRSKKQTAYAKVNIRLVDVATSQIIYSEEGEGEASSEAQTTLGVGNTADYDATLNDKVLSAAISKLVNNVISHLMDKAWKSYLLSYQEGNYIIAGGELQGLQTGDILSVYKKGTKVINPQTNVEIELPGSKIGEIKVVSLIKGDINTEISICAKVSGNIPVADFTNYYILEK